MTKIAKQAGYTVHGPAADCGIEGWAFCIDGDYTDGFGNEQAAWQAAEREAMAVAAADLVPA